MCDCDCCENEVRQNDVQVETYSKVKMTFELSTLDMIFLNELARHTKDIEFDTYNVESNVFNVIQDFINSAGILVDQKNPRGDGGKLMTQTVRFIIGDRED